MLDAEQIILVIPVWNDSGRLTQFAPELVSAIRASNMPIHLVIADDGSTESEFSQLQLIVETVQAAGQSVDLLRLTPRSRKGGAISSCAVLTSTTSESSASWTTDWAVARDAWG